MVLVEFVELVDDSDSVGIVGCVELENLHHGLALPCVVCLQRVFHILGALSVLPNCETCRNKSTSSLPLPSEH